VQTEPLRDIDMWLGQFRRFWTPRLDALSTEIARGRREQRLSGEDGKDPKQGSDR